jgi:hypothetical protein
VLATAMSWACAEPAVSPEVSRTGIAALGSDASHTIVVNPDANGSGIANTIQEGIDRVTAGGTVLVKGGTYAEALLVNKGVTLQPIGGGAGPVVIAPPGSPLASIDIATTEPVVIRDLTVLKPGSNGILGNGAVDVTVERLNMIGTGTGAGTNRLVRIVNNASVSGSRARLAVRGSSFDGARTGTLAVSLQADIDAVIANNHMRRMNICIFVISFGAAGISADIVDNDLDECEGRTAIDVGPTPTQVSAFGTTGVVNIVGNTIRNTGHLCLPTTAIHYQLYSGKVERNSVVDFVQACATGISDALPSAIWVGSLRGFPAAAPVVRFNDISGNAHAGLRIAPNITTPLDAFCNYWGAATGPTAAAWPPGTGDAVVVEVGAATPAITPFARSVEDLAVCGTTWSEPVNLGPIINSSASEMGSTLSPDELRLYFVSNRAGGQGLTDLYVSRRASLSSPWEPPVNLGPVVNTSGTEGGASFSPDAHWMYFQSGRSGGFGLNDIYVSYRPDPNDDFGWGQPVNLGPLVNTPFDEAGSEYVESPSGSTPALYFNRSGVLMAAQYDLYTAALDDNGRPTQPAAPISELNLPTPISEFGPALSDDGLELLFISNRPGTLGGLDLWITTRASPGDAWPPPQTLGPPVNTPLADRDPTPSADGRTMIFSSARPGGVGGSQDLWVTTRRR